MFVNPAAYTLLQECGNPRSYAALPGLRDVIGEYVWKYLHPQGYHFSQFIVVCGQVISLVIHKSRYGFYHNGKYAALNICTDPYAGEIVTIAVHSLMERHGLIHVDFTMNDVKYRGNISVSTMLGSILAGNVTLQNTAVCDYPDWRYVSSNRKFYQVGQYIYRKADLKKRRRGRKTFQHSTYYNENNQWYVMNGHGQLLKFDLYDAAAAREMMIGPDMWL